MKNRIKNYVSKVGLARAVAVISAALVVGVAITLSSNSPAGWLTYSISLPALLGILITCLARINDISPQLKGTIWQARRFGLALVGASAVTFMYMPFSVYPLFPSWLSTSLFWGYFITWVSTPNMPPWYDYITGNRNPRRKAV